MGSPMKFLDQSVLIVILVSAIGCASQPSSYVDKSTPEQRNIEATGAAAVEAARSNSSTNVNIESNVPLVSGVKVSSNQSGTYYSQLPSICCAYHPDGSRNHQREHEIYVEKQYAKQQRERGNTYGGYATQRASSQFDWRLKQKIDKEIDRFMEKIF